MGPLWSKLQSVVICIYICPDTQSWTHPEHLKSFLFLLVIGGEGLILIFWCGFLVWFRKLLPWWLPPRLVWASDIKEQCRSRLQSTAVKSKTLTQSISLSPTCCSQLFFFHLFFSPKAMKYKTVTYSLCQSHNLHPAEKKKKFNTVNAEMYQKKGQKTELFFTEMENCAASRIRQGCNSRLLRSEVNYSQKKDRRDELHPKNPEKKKRRHE